MSTEQQGQQGQQPTPTPPKNVRLAHGRNPVTVEGEVNIGGHAAIKLPDEETQREGFHLDDEALVLLLHQYPRVYVVYKPLAVPVPPPATPQQGQQGEGQQGGTNEGILSNEAQGQQGQGQGEEAQ